VGPTLGPQFFLIECRLPQFQGFLHIDRIGITRCQLVHVVVHRGVHQVFEAWQVVSHIGEDGQIIYAGFGCRLHPGIDQAGQTSGVEFSSFKRRYIRSLDVALPSELAALGKTYLHGYGNMSSEIHFTPQEISSDFDHDAAYLGIDRVGLLCYAILIRSQLLLGIVPDGFASPHEMDKIVR
jgi:hypothetical protein